MSVIPAALGESPSGHAPGIPYSPVYDDVYHAVAGAWAQARHVFLGGNGLPARWQRQTRFVILETGFGLGNNFLATWATWLADAERCDRLVFISIEKHPLTRDDLARVHAAVPDAQDPDAGLRAALSTRLIEQWPPLTAGWHTRHFDEPLSADGRLQGVTLMLGLGDIAELLPSLLASVNAFYLDGFAPAKNPDMWDEGLLSRLDRLAAPDATAATWSAARGVRDALTRAGFVMTKTPGFAGKRDMIQGHFAPRYVAPPPAGGLQSTVASPHRHALVIGAGLAGCSAAHALCRQGWRVTLMDRHAGPAQEGSGNPGGLFHSIVHGEDGIHARAHRSAALATWSQIKGWIADGQVAGQTQGLIRLDAKTHSDDAKALIAKLNLPDDHVEWLDRAQAAEMSGLNLPCGGWFFHQAGWVHPAGYAKQLLSEAAPWQLDGQPLLSVRWHSEVASLTQAEDGAWLALDGHGVEIARAASVVMACAHQAAALCDKLPEALAVSPVPLSRVRGQITAIAHDTADFKDVTLPRLPVAGSGYVLPLGGKDLLCGATTQHHDEDPAVRQADHIHNLGQAKRLGAWHRDLTHPSDVPDMAALFGRTGWRATTPDRLPLVGALPWSIDRIQAASRKVRMDQVRLIPRQRTEQGGLFVVTGLGSRGITWAALAGELLAHWVTGSPCPVEIGLRDAMDPARFLARTSRQTDKLMTDE